MISITESRVAFALVDAITYSLSALSSSLKPEEGTDALFFNESDVRGGVEEAGNELESSLVTSSPACLTGEDDDLGGIVIDEGVGASGKEKSREDFLRDSRSARVVRESWSWTSRMAASPARAR